MNIHDIRSIISLIIIHEYSWHSINNIPHHYPWIFMKFDQKYPSSSSMNIRHHWWIFMRSRLLMNKTVWPPDVAVSVSGYYSTLREFRMRLVGFRKYANYLGQFKYRKEVKNLRIVSNRDRWPRMGEVLLRNCRSSKCRLDWCCSAGRGDRPANQTRHSTIKIKSMLTYYN